MAPVGILLMALGMWGQLTAAQFSVDYRAAPANCGQMCFPPEGYALYQGQTICMCRTALCRNVQCGPQEECKVFREGESDTTRCEKKPQQDSPVPYLLANFDTAARSSLTETELCAQPPETGWCRALIKRYYYNATENVCKEFVYGGCQGNQNNFESLEQCLQTCHPNIDTTINNGGNNGGNAGQGTYSNLQDSQALYNFLFGLLRPQTDQPQ